MLSDFLHKQMIVIHLAAFHELCSSFLVSCLLSERRVCLAHSAFQIYIKGSKTIAKNSFLFLFLL